MDNLLIALASVQTRIAAGFAMLAALATLLLPTADWTFNLPAALGFVATFVVWLLAELRSATVRYPHDVRLADDLLLKMTIGERAILRTMDFAEDFQWTDFPGLREIGQTWEGADYAFLDASLQRAWGPTLEGIVKFRRELALRSAPRTGAGNWFTVKTARQDGPGEEMSAQARRDAEFLNAEADKLSKQLDAFISKAKRHLSI